MFISTAVNRITLKLNQKCQLDAIATFLYAENDTLYQQPAVRCQTDKKLTDPGINQRNHCQSLQYLTSVVEHLGKPAKPKHLEKKGKYSTSS